MASIQGEQVCGLHRGPRPESARFSRSVFIGTPKYLQENTMENTGLSLGIDIGGTFTDLCLLDPRDGKTTIWKQPTTAEAPSRGAMMALARPRGRSGTKPQEITRLF